MKGKWESFGWDTQEIDGHDFSQIKKSLDKVKTQNCQLIIAHTIKGKGVSFMEDNNNWHYRIPNEDELKMALDELSNSYEKFISKEITTLAKENKDIVLLSRYRKQDV